MSNVVDFTKMRLGRVVRTYKNGHKAKISVCEKCGRKGEPGAYEAKNGKQCFYWNHAGKVVGVAGMQFFEVTDHCMVTKQVEAEGANLVGN